MFDNLSDKLQRVFKNLRGEGRLTAANMETALREIRVALLEADVNFKVVKQLIEAVKQKAMGEEVLISLSPTQQVIAIVRDELVKILGSHESKLRFANDPPSVILIVGLQGSGKTTSSGKLANGSRRTGNGRNWFRWTYIVRPRASSCASSRETSNTPIYAGTPEETNPLELARSARRDAVQCRARRAAGGYGWPPPYRRQADDRAEELKQQLNPVEILFVADAMTGQDAVKSADEFHKRLGITGVILTKMDGDARGGAALSIRHVTGQPLKFVGVGEKPDAFEPFYPDRAAQRILGMGDVLSFIEKAEEVIDKKKAEEMQQKLLDNEFTLEDFRDQIKQIRKLGPLESLTRHDAEDRYHERAEERKGR